jgi:hypothetical protein
MRFKDWRSTLWDNCFFHLQEVGFPTISRTVQVQKLLEGTGTNCTADLESLVQWRHYAFFGKSLMHWPSLRLLAL